MSSAVAPRRAEGCTELWIRRYIMLIRRIWYKYEGFDISLLLLGANSLSDRPFIEMTRALVENGVV